MNGFGVFFYVVFILIIIFAVQSKARRTKTVNINTPNIDLSGPMNQLRSMYAKLTIPIVVVFILLVILFKSFVVIPPGYTGVYELFGTVKDAELSSGIHIVNPLGSITKMSIRTQEYTMSVASEEGALKGDDSIAALTNEGLEVNLDITVLYHLEEPKASDIYSSVGLNYVQTVVRPAIRSIIREEVSQYSAKEIYSNKREELSGRISEKLGMDMNARGLILEDVLLRNVQLPPKLAQSIQEKLTAEQESERYNFVLDKEKKEAERKRIEAEGQRDSQTIINQSLSPEYLEYLYITSLKDREGTIYVPVNPDNGLPLFRNVD